MGHLIASPALVAAALMLCGCLPVEPGKSGVEAEQNRVRGQHGFSVLSSAPARTVFVAKGNEVVIAPASGFCVAPESLDVSGNAAFALLSDCAARSAAKTARTFPGVLTVSISGAPLVDPGADTAETLEGLEAFLTGDDGRALLGRGSGKARVKVMATRRVGEGIYVLVEDGSAGPLPMLAPRFWRAFVELGGRMAMVTASGFRDVPVGEDEVLAFLVSQVVALKRANNAAASDDELQMAQRVNSEYVLVDAAGAGPESTRVEIEIEPYGSGDAVAETGEVETPAAGQAVATLASTATPAAEVYSGPNAGADTRADVTSAGTEAAQPVAASEVATGSDTPAPVAKPVYRGPVAADMATAGPSAAQQPAPVARPAPAPPSAVEPYAGRTTGDAVYRGPNTTAVQ